MFGFKVSGLRHGRVLWQDAVSIKPIPPMNPVSVRDYGAWVDGQHNDSAAVGAALATARGTAVQVPPGTCYVTALPEAIVGRFAGEGQILTGDGNRRGRMFARRAAAPSSYGSLDDISTAFNGDLSTVQLAIEHRLDGPATLGQPNTGYLYRHENSAVSLYFQNRSGYNALTDNQGGRTGCSAFNGRVTQEGQGDAVFLSVTGTVFGTKPGSTHFLANPAVLVMDGDLYGFADGTYQEVDEFSHNDAGFDVAVSSTVRNFYRTNNVGAKGAWWVGARYQSNGVKPADAAWQAVGRWNTVLDTTSANLGATQAAATLAPGQRIYLGATNPDPFANPAKIQPGPHHLSYDSAKGQVQVAVNDVPVIQASAQGVEANVLRQVSNWYAESGKIDATDRLAVVTCTGQVSLVLDDAKVDGHEMVIKRLGKGSALVTLTLDGCPGSVITMGGWTHREAFTIAWSTKDETWLLLGCVPPNGALLQVDYGTGLARRPTA